ncbi:glycoside hydrolase family 16 protein [Actinoplanes sp. M2I2]|uniref:glycoside hydrolase family 16 protein n=1 Tax=Actinoplanes sp. M2I2 TaxID=1734444 RepID=UPI002021A280|nr:glycoside hydrolase family 16 protein [Actinoplanes sp. M2I2]
MKASRTRRVAAAAVALLTAMTLAEPAVAGSRGVPAAAARSAGLESSLEDRVRAAALVGVVAPDSWLVLNERDFVFEIWKNAEDLSEVRGAAELALMNCTTTSYVQCTVFVESGIHDAKARDVADQVRDGSAAREAREIRQRALLVLEIAVTPELLLLTDRDFVFALYQRSAGERVRAAALVAFGGSAQQQRDFITVGVVAAREQDRAAEIEADQERTEAERQALLEREARKRAAAILGVVATEATQVLSDENFVRWVWNTAAEPTEVYAAAMAALRSADPVAWRTFIHTGIHQADHRDLEAALKKKGEEDRRRVSAIEAAADAAGKTNLARAARTALAGSDTDVSYFLRVGQYQVSDNECANPALAVDATGWGRLSSSLVVTRRAITGHPDAQWELSVANGTAVTAGIFLPKQQVLPGSVWDVAADVRAPDDPSRARTEIDWYGPGDVYLGHTNGGYLPVAGTSAFTRISGRFTVPAGAVRANVLLRFTDLAANSQFGATSCAYKPNPKPDVSVTGVPGNGTGSLTWSTTRTDIVGWNVGRDGTDTRNNGPWATDVAAGVGSQQFNLLRNDTTYSFILIPRTAAGPLTPVSVSVTPSTNPPPTDGGGGTGNGVEAAVRLGWGAPLAQYSDEFTYTGRPDPAKWSDADECWRNPHASGGQRCASATTVDGQKLVMTGAGNGTTGWLQNDWKTRYGRWEARVRSRNTGSSNGRTYHPLLIVWPDGDKWPEEGEYDFLENSAPGAACAVAFLHYPVLRGDTQQERAEERNCGAPLSEWHNIAFEWTPDHVRGLIDGIEWFRFSNGSTSSRKAMQAMASGHLTIQLDNFDGTNMTPAVYEADWVRVYRV